MFNISIPNRIASTVASSSLVFSAVVGIGLFAESAQAGQFQLGDAAFTFEGNTDNFFGDVGKDSVTVNFTDMNNVKGTAGNLLPPAAKFDLYPQDILPDEPLKLTRTSGDLNPDGDVKSFEYISAEDFELTFTKVIAPNAVATVTGPAAIVWTVPAGSRFLLEETSVIGQDGAFGASDGKLQLIDAHLPYISWGGELQALGAEIEGIDEEGNPITFKVTGLNKVSTLAFEVVSTANAGGFTGSYQQDVTLTPEDDPTVPEPGTLLGLLAAGSMGLVARKRK